MFGFGKRQEKELVKISNKLDKVLTALNMQNCFEDFTKHGICQVFRFNCKVGKYVEECLNCGRIFNKFNSEEEMLMAKVNKIKEYSDWLLKTISKS